MDLSDAFATTEAQERIDAAESTIRSRDKTINDLKRQLRSATSQLDDNAKLLTSITAIQPTDTKMPKWMTPKLTKRSADHHVTPVLMLSDLHLDEVVDLRAMGGMNEYNRKIAEERLTRTIDFAVEFNKRYISGVVYDGMVVALLGDIITGVIHEELAKTNEAEVPDTVAHWVPILASGLSHLADSFGNIHVPCVDGNHDRTTAKTQMKRRAQASYAWIVYKWIADHLRHDDRITFGISPSSDQVIDVYSTKLLLVHGDGFRGGGGVGGIYPPLLKYLYRQQAMWTSIGRPWDYCLMGHWHSLMWGTNFIVNGSTKGFDEFARRCGFGFEPAQQALFHVTPERGITTRVAVHCD